MDKDIALQQAIEIAKITIQHSTENIAPVSANAQAIADFIETLAKRLDEIGGR